MLEDIIQESPLFELAREYGETRGEAHGLRNACLVLTKTKAPRLVAILEGHLGDIADLPQLESCSSIWALPRTRRPFSPPLATTSRSWFFTGRPARLANHRRLRRFASSSVGGAHPAKVEGRDRVLPWRPDGAHERGRNVRARACRRSGERARGAGQTAPKRGEAGLPSYRRGAADAVAAVEG